MTHDLMGIVDLFFVGKLGPAAVAAVALAITILGIVIMLGLGVTAGTTALVANAVGMGRRARAGEVAAQSILLACVLAGIAAALGVPLSAAALRLLGADPEVVAIGAGYLRIMSGGSICMMAMMTFGATLRGAGDAVTPFRAMVLGNIVNAVLDPIFIFGWLGLPAMGVPGSAWATLIGRCVALTVMVRVFFIDGHEHFHLRLQDLKPHWRTISQILKIGVFASGGMLLRNIAALALIRLVAVFGTIAVAAYGIGMRLRMLILGPSMGFGTAAATVVGQNLGAGKPERAEKAGWTAVGICMVIAVCLTVVFWLGGEQLIALFNDDPGVIAIGCDFLRWFSIAFPFLALGFVLSRAMAGAGDTLRPMIITGVTLVAFGIPLAYGLAYTFESVRGIWAAVAACHIIEGLLIAYAFRRGQWKNVGARISGDISQPVP